MDEITKNSIINAVLTVLYVTLISSFLYFAPQAIGHDGETILIPIIMLLLFVLSAAVCGTLVFGRPVLWYMDGRKKEAVSLLSATLAVLAVITIAAIVLILAVRTVA